MVPHIKWRTIMKLHTFPASPNARKTLTANGLLGLNLETVTVDLSQGAQKSPEFVALNPNSKIPVLEFDDGSTLWESNAIINRMATEVDTELWPKSNARYDIMRWQFWESAHWAPACSKFISKNLFGNDSVDMDAATTDFTFFAGVLDSHLGAQDWLVGDAMTNADISVAAILCYREPCQYPLGTFTNINRWIARIEGVPAWQMANAA